jgi:release factor glutamine methyltransferase
MKVSQPSIAQELVEGGRILAGAGVPEPRREAIALWAGLTGIASTEVWMDREGPALESDARRFRLAVERRARGEPLAYVLGAAAFRYLHLKVDRRALIPRPETEGLVDHVLAWGRARARLGRGSWGVAADIGTGSGCIALSLALEGEFDRVIATDVCRDAIEVAAQNVLAVGPETPVEIRLGTLLQPLANREFGAVVSNPPYVTAAEYEKLEPGVREFEPRTALVSGEEGMEHTRALLEGTHEILTPGGLLAIEVDSTRAERAISIAREAGFKDAHIEEDLFGRPRYFLATKEF